VPGLLISLFFVILDGTVVLSFYGERRGGGQAVLK
jgi:hypothetical protein